jgi:hypothetical protein
VEKIYYICPNIAQDEVQIVNTLIHLAKKHRLTFCISLGLHPQAGAMLITGKKCAWKNSLSIRLDSPICSHALTCKMFLLVGHRLLKWNL